MRYASRGFILCLLALVSLSAISLIKGIDTSMAIVGVIGAYMARRGAEGVASVNAAAKDPEADTLAAIEMVAETKKKPQ